MWCVCILSLRFFFFFFIYIVLMFIYSTPTYPATKRAWLATQDVSWTLGWFFFLSFFFTILTFIYLFMIRPHCLTLTCLTLRLPCWHIQPAPKQPPDDEKGSRCISSPCYMLPHHHLAHLHWHQHNQLPEYVTLGLLAKLFFSFFLLFYLQYLLDTKMGNYCDDMTTK